MIEKALEILRDFLEIVHVNSERVPQNELEFLKFCNEPINVIKILYLNFFVKMLKKIALRFIASKQFIYMKIIKSLNFILLL